MRHLRFPLAVTAALLAAAPASAGPGAAARPDGNATACARATDAVERAGGVPLRLLEAISLVESGRWDAARGARIAWPWTVHAEGRGRFFATRRAAVAAVRRLRRRGVESIDVGCMQVNLYHHPHAFGSIDEAFDPMINVAYAAGFLNRLRRETRSLTRAVAQYHSSDDGRGRPYWVRVRAAWNAARMRYYRDRREARLRDFRARRARRIAARMQAAGRPRAQ